MAITGERPKAKKSKVDEVLDGASDDTGIVETAKKLFERDRSAWSGIYQKAEDDLFFLSDDPMAQWDATDYKNRTGLGRPALTIDQLSQFVHQVANDIRQNTPSINIIPSGEEADEETAEVCKGLIRNIEYNSNADDVYDTAALNAIKSSIGFIFVDHDYAGPDGFEQELLIKRVINPLACWIDSDSIECDGRDAKHGTMIYEISVADFKRNWPSATVSSFDGDEKAQVEHKDGDYIKYAQFFQIEETETEITDEATGKTRKTARKKVNRYKLSGTDVLEKTTFPGEYVPIVPVYGEEAWKNGKRNLLSLIRKAKGAQQMYNYWKSLETELLMKQPIAPVMAAEGQLDAFAKDWLDPSKAFALRYKTTDAKGNPIPPPSRLEPPMISAGILNAARESVDDIKAALGMYNASLGQKSNETSGIAIQRRQQEGDVATFHFSDNLVRSITQVGRILVCAFPEIYDTPRIIRTIGVEDEPKQIGINGMLAEGQKRPFDLRRGKYDVRVVTGASFTTKRQEAAQFFTEIVKQQPQLMQVMGDLLFKNMDFTGAPAMAERMKKLIPPNLLENEDGQEGPPPPDPEKIQMTQVIQQLQAELQQAQAEAQNKNGELMIKQGDLQIKQSDIDLKTKELMLKDKELDIKSAEAKAKFELENRKIYADLIDKTLEGANAQNAEASQPIGEEVAQQTGPEQIELVLMHFAAAMQHQTETLAVNLQQMAQAQHQASVIAAQSGAQGDAAIAAAISEPKEVVYNANGEIVGVKPARRPQKH